METRSEGNKLKTTRDFAGESTKPMIGSSGTFEIQIVGDTMKQADADGVFHETWKPFVSAAEPEPEPATEPDPEPAAEPAPEDDPTDSERLGEPVDGLGMFGQSELLSHDDRDYGSLRY